jgi:hypothetical protein
MMAGATSATACTGLYVLKSKQKAAGHRSWVFGGKIDARQTRQKPLEKSFQPSSGGRSRGLLASRCQVGIFRLMVSRR